MFPRALHLPRIESCELPHDALLQRHRAAGAHTDCFATDLAHPVSHAQYVEAFYTTRVFKAERLVLRWLASTPSTDLQAHQLATGAIDAFAAWHVEARAANQLLLRDATGRTCSWLMAVPIDLDPSATGTRLYFGSAVLPVTDARTGSATLGFPYQWLMGAHKLYSRTLLRAASSRLAG